MFSSPVPAVEAPSNREKGDEVVVSSHPVCAVTRCMARKAGGEEVLDVYQYSGPDSKKHGPPLDEPRRGGCCRGSCRG